MATKPGPAVALAALAALFLLKGKGGSGSGKPALDDVPDGTEMPDDTPNKPASPSGGGKKVPKGTGGGGGSWDPGKIGPTTFWISPDCRNVIEGPEYYDKVLVPALLKVFQDFDSRYQQSVEMGWNGGSIAPDLFNVLAVALGFRELTPPSATPFDGPVFADTKHASVAPGSCVMEAPVFHVGTTYKSTGSGVATESLAAFNEALEDYFGTYPQLAMWLYSLQQRMVLDERLPENSREFSSLFDLGFLTKTRTGSAGNPPERAPDLSVADLYNLVAIAAWWVQAQAYISKWKSSYSKAINEYEDYVSSWYAESTDGGQVTPAGPDEQPEEVALESSPATTGILVGRVLGLPPVGQTLLQPVADASITIAGQNLTTNNEGYFEVAIPAGWHELTISSGSKSSIAYATVEAGQTNSVDLIGPV